MTTGDARGSTRGRRGNSEGSIHQRANGRWVGCLHVGYESGKRKRKYLYGRTQAEVRTKVIAARHDLQQGQQPTDDRLTVAAYLDRWLQQVARPVVRASTYRSYEEIIRNHLSPTLGRRVLSRLSIAQVQEMLNLKRATLSATTVHRVHEVLRSALSQAEREQLVVRNVARLARPPAITRHEIQPFAPEEARLLLRAVHGGRWEGFYSLVVTAGLRLGEALGLRWQDVDLDGAVIHVRHSLAMIDGEWQLAPPKTERSRRSIPLGDIAVAALRAHRARQAEMRLAAGDRWSDLDYVFSTETGLPLDQGNVRRAHNRILRDAGLPHRRIHDLRHTCATFLIAQGMDLRVVMEVLGHSQISLTANTYAHVLPSLTREAASRLHAVLTESA